MANCTGNGFAITPDDRVLPIVPMFHANAWGNPYAALMAGADLLLPDRLLEADPLLDMIERHEPTVAAAVPTIWNDVMHYLEALPRHFVAASGGLRRFGGSGGDDANLRGPLGVQIRQPWGMTETSPMAAMAWPPPTSRGPALGAPRNPGPPVRGRGPHRRRRRHRAAQ